MKTALEDIKEITGDFRAYRATVTVMDINKIKADALLHAAAKIRNTGSSSQQWMATDLETEAEQLTASAETHPEDCKCEGSGAADRSEGASPTAASYPKSSASGGEK